MGDKETNRTLRQPDYRRKLTKKSKDMRDHISLVLIFATACVGNTWLAMIFIAAIALLQFDKIENLLKR